jgi:cell division protein ZapA (FtsZ GTPase activity inhibitor)
MTKQKQSRVDLLEKKFEAVIRVIQQMMEETAFLKDLSVGTLETIKLMDDYQDAIDKLKENLAKEKEENEPEEKKLEL